MLGVHHRQALDVAQAELDHALLGLAQHRLRQVDADDAVDGGIVRQRYAGADPDLENATADLFGGDDGGLPAALEHRTKNQVIDRRPARIGLGDRLFVQLYPRIHHDLLSVRSSALRRGRGRLIAGNGRP